MGGDGLPEPEQAEIGGVTGFAAFQGIDGGFADMPGGDEIRLTHAQGNDARFPLDQFKKVADSGAGDVPDIFGD